ncbi:MAG: MFS transporter [Rhizomicrobium sp.]
MAGRAGAAETEAAGPALLFVSILAIATLVIDGFDTQLAAFAAPLILREWHIGKLAFAPVFAAVLGGMAIGAALGGALGDRFGRRRIVVVSTVLFGCGTILVSFGHAIQTIVLLRLASGLGFGAVLPNVFTLIAEWTPPRLRPTLVTISTIGVPMGGMIGAAIVAWAMPRFGWRDCFAGAGIATLFYAGLLALRLPESPAFLGRSREEPSAAVPGGSLAGLFSRVRARRTLGLALASFAAGYLGYAFATWVPVMLTTAGFSLGLAISGSFFVNLFAIVGALTMAVSIPLLGSRSALLGSLVVFAGATCAVGPVLGFAGAVPGSGPVALVMLTLCLIGFGIGALASSTFALAVHAYPTALRATGAGLANGLNRLGAFLTPFVGAWLLDIDGSRSDTFMMSVLAFIAAATIGTLVYDAHIRRRADMGGS